MSSNEFVTDILDIRSRARAWMTDTAVADEPGTQRIVKVLNEVLAAELACASRYTCQCFVADMLHAEAFKKAFLEHATDEWAQADMVAARIAQLGGEPDFNPASLVKRSHAQYVLGEALYTILKENLVAKRIAIATFTEIAQWLNDRDPVGRLLVEDILRYEQEHTDALTTLLGRFTAEDKDRRLSGNAREFDATLEPDASPMPDYERANIANVEECFRQ